MKAKRFLAVFIARNKEFLRDRAALSWNILFPVLIVAGFAFAFAGEPIDRYKVALVQDNAVNKTGNKTAAAFLDTRYIHFYHAKNLQQTITKVERHQVDMLLDRQGKRYWINETSPQGYMLEKILHASGEQTFKRVAVSGSEIRYVDWVLPGVLGMNMMFSALFGVGYVLVRYRKNGVLKRLKATPLSALEFLTAQVLSRLMIILAITTSVYFGTNLFVDFAMFGSYFNLFLVFALGAASLISMGLLIAARTASEEFAGGMLNLVSWPMMFLSGVWFSLEGLHPVVQKISLIFPLTHITTAARSIMIDGVGLAEVSTEIFSLIGMSLVFLMVGALGFRWE